MKKLFTPMLICLVLFLSACSQTPHINSAAKEVTEKVCNASTQTRAALREQVDEATFPNKIRVQCAGND